jgi:spore coat protein U-like protein
MNRIARYLLLMAAGIMPLEGFAANGTCTVAATPLAFGSYSPLSASPVDSTATISVTCTAITILFIVTLDVDYTISLSKGGAGSYSPRKLSLLANTLNYNLYTDNARSIIWGDGTGGTSTKSGSMHGTGLLFSSVTDNHTVYGRLPGSQNISAGAYTDLITVTVNY